MNRDTRKLVRRSPGCCRLGLRPNVLDRNKVEKTQISRAPRRYTVKVEYVESSRLGTRNYEIGRGLEKTPQPAAPVASAAEILKNPAPTPAPVICAQMLENPAALRPRRPVGDQ
jgi:hypothetical protein